MFEPSELERGHMTDVDQEIRSADIPERFHVSLLLDGRMFFDD